MVQVDQGQLAHTDTHTVAHGHSCVDRVLSWQLHSSLGGGGKRRREGWREGGRRKGGRGEGREWRERREEGKHSDWECLHTLPHPYTSAKIKTDSLTYREVGAQEEPNSLHLPHSITSHASSHSLLPITKSLIACPPPPP